MAQQRIVLSPQALADLASIRTYIAAESGASRADGVIARIYRTLASLSFLPGIGRVRTEFKGSPRVFPVSPWLILYEMAPELDGIRVIRVIDGRRDVDSVL